MSIHEVIHPCDDIKTLYVSRKEEGRRLVRIQDWVDASKHTLEYDIKKSKEGFITAANNIIKNNNTDRKNKNKTKQKTKIKTRKQL